MLREAGSRDLGSLSLYYAASGRRVPTPNRFQPGTTPILGRVRGFFQDWLEAPVRVIH